MNTIANSALPSTVQQPNYDRAALRSRIVHIGFGAFHRAHQALLTYRVLNTQGGDWGICEVSLFGADTLIQELRKQDHLFSVLEKGAQGNQAIVVGSVCESVHARLDGIMQVLAKLVEPQVAIVSLTITEKGYCIEPGTANWICRTSLFVPIWPSLMHRHQHLGCWWKHSACAVYVDCLPLPSFLAITSRKTVMW